MKAVEWFATVLTVAGFFLLSEKIFVAGFITSIVANLLWMAWGYDSKAYGIVAVNALLLLSGINGLM